jgi:endonuclease YncB( thermonuclease family)
MRLFLMLLAIGVAFGQAPPTARVVSVYDGDTFTLDTGDKVRLQWINTPELRPSEPYGIEAREAADAFLGGKEVTLIYGAVKKDGYGRLLAAAQVDGRWLAEHLLELGLGHLFLIPPVEDSVDVQALIAAQERARSANRGIWSTDRYQGSLHITSFHANAPGDDRENINGEYLRICNLTPKALNLDGFRIADASGNSWTFPPMIVPPGHTFQVHSGVGDNQVDAKSQLAIYLGSGRPVWNNKYDRAVIYDRYGRVMDAREHKPKNSSR